MFPFLRKQADAQAASKGNQPAVLFKTAIRIRSRASHNATEGVPWIWVCAGALVTILLLIAALFGVIISQATSALWPHSVVRIQQDQQTVIGVAMRQEEGTDPQTNERQMRRLVYQANRDFGINEFTFIPSAKLAGAERPASLWFVERREWGPFIGRIQTADPATAIDIDEKTVSNLVNEAAMRAAELRKIEKGPLADLNASMEEIRLDKKKIERLLETGKISEDDAAAKHAELDKQLTESLKSHAFLTEKVQQLRSVDEAIKVTLLAPNGQSKTIPASQIMRAYQPNSINIIQRMGLFFGRLWSFVSEEPREANTEGGVFPALFGTVAMTILMTLFVLPVGVMTAVYMREIAKQGFLVSLVRIAVNNLAGVPSIVYGVFGVGFFCYSVGATIDQLFFQDKLPNPTFGTGGVLWASLTLALLTVPVVIVSTEEALTAVPRSLREASYGCGATRMQTLWNIVLPKAMPGVMTGLILAMARAVGEVAPLLMTGVVKLAPALPVDTHFPFIHLERSFMHLGFHIYDLGFQSRSTELSRPMVFASTSLLVAIVLFLNFIAIKIRSELRKRFEGRGAF
ncbi:phosphate ABC transporter permease PstA [bacterium]|nr:phosphate ABC transporter permease PstA [bacterium]